MNIAEILEKATDNERISEKEALILLKSEENQFFEIAKIANEIRRKKVGDIVTYVHNRNINYTNICIGSCKFCAFRRRKWEKEGYLLSLEEIKRKAVEALHAGVTELCIQGGLHPDINLEFLGDIIKTVKEVSNFHIHAFSPAEIYHISKKSKESIKETLSYLKSCGLDSIPGTSAEILSDDVRMEICPDKIDTKTWIRIIRLAHRLGIPSTATIMYGHVEKPEHVVKHLKIIRDIQDDTGKFTEFIPLSFIPYRTELFKKNCMGASSLYDAKIFAVSRIFLDNFLNIQSSWVKLGKKLAQFMLYCGANDLGGTLMEENISSSTGITVKIPSVKELEMLIRQAGRIPKQRDTLYSHQAPKKI
ncbi:MAG: 7,8-didemethyl-8-hydroxy-5-deazariboflavin synthase subunit CofH [Thermoplasmata archaeon]|nr:MAG: 7,8-didemethyl-8-hydroxy-5-deazariboflavin synthase subunit CofH [Thermoplasmata archaeon]